MIYFVNYLEETEWFELNHSFRMVLNNTEKKEIFSWLKDQTKENVVISYNRYMETTDFFNIQDVVIFFEDKSEAILFKLRFS